MITRRKLLKLTLASLAAPALRSTRARGAFSSSSTLLARAVPAGPARPCPVLVLDGALAELIHPWTLAEGLLAGVSAARPQAIGYPGHHLADYWDWQTGWLDTPRLQNVFGLPAYIKSLMTHTGCVDLDELRVICAAAGAPALFTANLLTRSPRLNSPGTTNPLEDAAAGKAFLLDGLRACAARGISTRWLVLGDSLAGEQTWDWSPTKAVFNGDPVTGTTEYPLVALDWAAAARANNTSLAAAAFAVGNEQVDHLCVKDWNRRLVQQLAGQQNIRALAFSLTFYGGMGIRSETFSNWGDAAQQKQQYSVLRDLDKTENQQALRALFLQPPAALQTWLGQPLGDGRVLRDSGQRFWLNAFHLNDPIGALRYTWAHGLMAANALNAALREPYIDLVVLHNTADRFHAAFFSRPHPFRNLQLYLEDGVDWDLLVASALPGQRTALGHVFALFTAAAREATTAQPLALEPLDDPLVWGWVFTSSAVQARSVLLGNLSETGVNLDLSAVWAAVGGELEGHVYRAAPSTFITSAGSQPGAPFELEVIAAEAQGDHLYLPPYALALFSGLPLQNPVYLPMIQKYN